MIAINDLIARANVIDVTKIENLGKVIFGSSVKLQDLETEKQITYKLVGQDEADIKKNLIFFKSPIGKALIGKDKGEMVVVNTPSGEKNLKFWTSNIFNLNVIELLLYTFVSYFKIIIYPLLFNFFKTLPIKDPCCIPFLIKYFPSIVNLWS